MFDWSGDNRDEAGKSQGILISCVSGNPDNIHGSKHYNQVHFFT